MTSLERLDALPEGETILQAAVIAGSEYRYAVNFAICDGSRNARDYDYLLFTVHYYARIVYELATVKSLRNLPALVDCPKQFFRASLRTRPR